MKTVYINSSRQDDDLCSNAAPSMRRGRGHPCRPQNVRSTSTVAFRARETQVKQSSFFGSVNMGWTRASHTRRRRPCWKNSAAPLRRRIGSPSPHDVETDGSHPLYSVGKGRFTVPLGLASHLESPASGRVGQLNFSRKGTFARSAAPPAAGASQ